MRFSIPSDVNAVMAISSSVPPDVEAAVLGLHGQRDLLARQLEGVAAMRPQLVTVPDGVDRRLADPVAARHRAATPLRHSLELGAQRGVDDRLDLLTSIGRLAAASRGHLPQTLDPARREAFPPQRH